MTMDKDNFLTLSHNNIMHGVNNNKYGTTIEEIKIGIEDRQRWI